MFLQGKGAFFGPTLPLRKLSASVSRQRQPVRPTMAAGKEVTVSLLQICDLSHKNCLQERQDRLNAITLVTLTFFACNAAD